MTRHSALARFAAAWIFRRVATAGAMAGSAWLFCLMIAPGAHAATASQFLMAPPPGTQCRAAIALAERAGGIPPQLLAAIARVESGRRDPVAGSVAPWPWTVNAEGQGYFFDSKAEAIAAVRKMRAGGMRSIDVGCLQVNLMHHPDAFPNLEAAFDPVQNAAYAAKFLNDLHSQSGSWPKATAMYHSANPELGEPYQRKVLTALPDEKQLAGQPAPSLFASATGGRFSTFGARGAGFVPIRQTDNSTGLPSRMPGSGMAGSQGRGLDAYRAAPIGMIARIRRIGG